MFCGLAFIVVICPPPVNQNPGKTRRESGNWEGENNREKAGLLRSKSGALQAPRISPEMGYFVFLSARERTTGRRSVFRFAKAKSCRLRGFLWECKCQSPFRGLTFRIPVTGTSQSPVKIRKTVVPKGKTLANTPILRYYGKVTDTGGKSPRNLPAKRRKQEESRT